MTYKKFIKRDGKTYGPYIYHSKKINGRVTSEYLGKYENKKRINPSILAAIFVSLLLMFSFFFVADKKDFSASFQSIKKIVSEGVHLTGLAIDENISVMPNEAENITLPRNITETPAIINETVNETIILPQENNTETNITTPEMNITLPKENITNPEVNITTSEINITVPEASITEINITQNNITETNITAVNITVQNLTEANATATIQTVQYQAVLNQRVKWVKQIIPETAGNLTLNLPPEADNITIKEIKGNNEKDITGSVSITGAVVGAKGGFLSGFFKKLFGAITGHAVAENSKEKEVEIEIENSESEYNVEYYTDAPYSMEDEKNSGKIVEIVGPENIHYENVLSFTNLDEKFNLRDSSKIKIHWIESNKDIPISKIEDTNGNGIYDYVEWVVPHLSSQTFEIIIEISQAEHLDSNKQFISGIYEQVKALDDVWSETIPSGDYVRVTFEKNLTNENDITLFPRIISGNPIIEVYEKNQQNKIAEFNPLISDSYNKIYLTNLPNSYSQDAFDLKISGGDLQFDYITDPNVTIDRGGAGDIAMTPLSEKVFVFAYTNYSNNNLYFKIVNPNGTSVLGPVFVDRISNAQAARVSLATINSSSFAIGWTNRSNSDDLRAVYLINGSRIVGPSATDTNIGTWAWDLAMTSLGDSYAYCYVNEVNDSIRVYTVNNEGNIATGINTISGNMTPRINMSNTMDCDAINSTAVSIVYYDTLGGSVMFATVDQNANIISERTTIDITALGKGGLVKTTGLNGDTAALVWMINATRRTNPQNITAVIKDANNNTIESETVLVNNLGNWSRIATAAVANNSGDYLVLAWINSSVIGGAAGNGTIQLQVFNSSLNEAGSVITVDRANVRYPIIYLMGKEQTVSSCQGTFALAYTNYSNFTLFKTYWMNGSSWDGNQCADTTKPTIQIFYPSNNTNTTNTQININYTASDNVALSACWYSNSSGRSNVTLSNCQTNITGITWIQGINNISIWSNDTSGNIGVNYVSFTVDTIPPYFTNLANQTITTVQSLNYDINAADDGVGFGSFKINWTNTFNIVASTGVLTNISGLGIGDYYINVSINDTLNNINSSILLVRVLTADNVPPNVTSLTATPSTPTTYIFGANYGFNTTLEDISPISTVLFQFNGINYSASTLGSNIYNITLQNLPAGTFSYRWFANDTNGNANNTETGSYTINKAIPAGNLTSSNGWSINYGLGTTLGVQEGNLGDFDVVYNISRDNLGTALFLNLSAGSYTIRLNTTGGQNYSSNSNMNLSTLIINQIISNVNLSLANKQSNASISEGTSINLNCSTLSGDAGATLVLYNNGSRINQGISPIGNTTTFANKAVYNITCIYLTTANFSQNSTTFYVEVSDITNPNLQIVFPSNNTNTTNIQLNVNYTVSDNSGISNCWYSNNSGLTNNTLTCGQNITGVTWIQGINNISVYANDTSGNTNVSYVTFTIDTINPKIQIIFPSNNTNTSNSGIDVNYTVSDVNLANCWYSNSSGRSNTTITCGQNITAPVWLEGINNVSVWTNDSAGNMNVSYVTFTIDSANPKISIISPLNNTNTSNSGIDVNYTVSDVNLANCWYSNDSRQNATLANCANITNVIWTEGIHNISVWANDTSGNTNVSYVSFTIDTINPNLQIVFPSNNTNTSNININVNYTVSDSSLQACWYTNNSGKSNNTITCGQNITGVTWIQGINNISVYANDTSGNTNVSYVSFFIDSVNPKISIISPLNNTNTTNIQLNVNYTVSDNNGLSRCWYTNNSGKSNNTITCGQNITGVTWIQGINNISVYANDTSGNTNVSYVTFTIDTINPNLQIVFPSNNTNTSNSGIDVNYTVSDVNLANCWYSNSSGRSNTTITCGQNITAPVWLEGINNVSVWTNDSAGNMNVSYVTFTIDSINPKIQIVFPSNNTNTSNSGIDVNYTFSDNIGISNCWYSNSSGRSNTTITCGQNITAPVWLEGINNVSVWTNDTSGNTNVSYVSFTIDTTNPYLSIVYPSNNTNTSNININVNYTVSDSSLQACWYTNSSGAVNYSLTCGQNITGVTWIQGINNIGIYVNDSFGNNNASYVTFTVDSVPPGIQIVFPSNNTNTSNSGIDVNYTVYNGFSSCWYSNTSGKINYTWGCNNITNVTWSEGINNVSVWANDSVGNANVSYVTFTIDTTKPSVASLTETPSEPVNYSEGGRYEFNATMTDSTLGSVLIEFNGINYTLRYPTGGVYNFSIFNLAVGNYSYRWFVNDSFGNVNNTEIRSYNVSKATPSLALSIIPGTSVTYGTQTFVNGTGCPSQLTCRLFQAGLEITNPENRTLGAGSYNYIYNTTGNSNYTSSNNASGILTVSKAVGAVYTYINNQRANKTINQFTSVYLNGSLINGTGNIKLFNNGTLINQGISPLANLTTFNIVEQQRNITALYEGNENYTSAYESWWLNVLEVDVTKPNLTIAYPQNATYNIDLSSLNYTAKDNQAVSYCWYSLNNGLTNSTADASCQNFTNLASNEGSNTWIVYANDTSGNENFSRVTFFKDTIPPGINFTFPTPANDSLQPTNSVYVNVSTNDANEHSAFIDWNKSLVGWWNFDGVLADGTVYDNSSYANNGLMVNFSSNITISGKRGEALSFDGVNDRIRIINSDALNAGYGSFSYGTFIRTATSSSSRIISKRVGGGAPFTGYELAIDPTGTLYCTLDDGITSYLQVQSIVAFNDNLWHHVMCVVNRNEGTLKLYVDGTSSSITIHGTNDLSLYSNLSNTNNLSLASFSPSSLAFFNGSMDEVMIFNRALSPQEINASYNAGLYKLYNNFTNLAGGTYNYKAYAIDAAGNINSTEERTLIIDTTNPFIRIDYPANNTNSSNNNLDINYTVSDANLKNCWYSNDTYSVNTSLASCTANITAVIWSEGQHNVTVWANDSAGNQNSSTISFIIDTIAPSINFTFPTPANATTQTINSVYVNVSTSDINEHSAFIDWNKSLVGWWSMDSYNSSGIYDNSTYNNFAGFYGGLSIGNLTLGKRGNALEFDGINDYARINYNQGMNITSNLTVELWFYHKNELIFNPLISRDNAVKRSWNIRTSNAGNMTFSVWNRTSASTASKSFTNSIQTWHHLAAVYNGTDILIYIDGVSGISVGLSGGINDTDIPLSIGMGAGTNSYWNGSIDEVMIFNRALSPQEINASYNAGLYKLYNNFTNLAGGTYNYKAYAIDAAGNINSTETRNIILVLPNLEIISPKNKTYIANTSLLLNFSASNQDSVKYNLDNNANTTIASATYFNTSAGSHTLYLFASNSNGEISKNVTFSINLTQLIIDRTPYIGNASGNSTNFNQYSYDELQNLSNIILENASAGKIQFNENINLTNDENNSDNLVNITKNVIISSNRIEVNSTALPNFNKSATLYLYGLSFTNPRILREGSLCPSSICTKESYLGGILKFNVTGFTVYSSEETPAETGAAPGAGGSSAGGAETVPGIPECSTNADCTEKDTVCWNHKCVKLFDVKITDFKSPAELGNFFEFTYFLKGMATINDDVQVNFWIEQNGEKVTTGSDTIYMGSFDSKTETSKIFLPTTLKSGVYQFYVEVYHKAYTAKSYRTIEVTVKGGVAYIQAKEYKTLQIIGLIIIALLSVLIILFVINNLRKRKSVQLQRTPEVIKEKPYQQIVQRQLPVRYSKKENRIGKFFRNLELAIANIIQKIKSKTQKSNIDKQKQKQIIKEANKVHLIREKAHIFTAIKVLMLRIVYGIKLMPMKLFKFFRRILGKETAEELIEEA